MSDIEVRPIRDDELRDYLRCLGIAFHFGEEVSEERLAFAREHFEDLSRRFGAFVAGSLSGTAASFESQLTVPGARTVSCAAVTQVTVLPTHRRRGLLAAMMRPQLQDLIDRGEQTAMLIAAEWPIYGRYGYGMAVEAASTVIDADASVFLDPTLEGSVELVDPATLAELAPAAFDRHRITSPGAINRHESMWPVYAGVVEREGMEAPKNRSRVVHRDPTGAVDGYAVYDPVEKWEHNRPRVALQAVELIGATPPAWRDLWKYLCGVDWVSDVRGNVRPVDEDLRPLLHNGRTAHQEDRSDHMWVRLLDVPGALAARRYEVPVSLVLDVHDPYLERGGRFLLEGDADGAQCKPTDREPDVSLGADVLGGAYLGGGSSLHAQALAGRIDEHTTGAIAALDRAMRTARAPWATTGF
jgi:predicted acetyltransferase